MGKMRKFHDQGRDTQNFLIKVYQQYFPLIILILIDNMSVMIIRSPLKFEFSENFMFLQNFFL